MQVDVQVGGGAAALDQRHGAAVAFVLIEPGVVQQVLRDHTLHHLHHLQHRRYQLGLRGQPYAQRYRQRQHPLPHRHVGDDVVDQVGGGLRHPPSTASRAESAPLAAERQQLVVAALPAAQPQEAVRQDATLEEGIELVLDEARQFTACAGLRLRDEACRVLLHQPGYSVVCSGR